MRFIRKYYMYILASIPVISLLLHMHVLNQDLTGIHVWRQTETQTIINNFYREDLNIFHPRVNRPADGDRLHMMEFPLMQWLFALFYKAFGPHIIITRLLSFITGLFSVYGIFYFAHKIWGNKAIATICAWCFNFSPVFYYYTINPMPDNMALCAGIWCMGFFYSYLTNRKILHLVYSGIFLCIATLTKLPFILYGSFMLACMAMLLRKQANRKTLATAAVIIALLVSPAAAWYAWVMPGWQNGVTTGILNAKQNAMQLLDIFTGTIVSVLPELLINYGAVLFFLAGGYFLYKKRAQRNQWLPAFAIWGLSLALYFLFEINMITTVHDYYLFPFLPGIFLVTGYGCYHTLSSGNKLLSGLSYLCLAILPITAFLRIDSRWDTADTGFNEVYYNYKQELRSITPPDARCITGNDPSGYILLYYIDRKGWTFDNNELSDQQLAGYIAKGAQYLFCDTRIDEQPGLQAHIAGKIFDKGTLRVYKLK